MQFDIMLAEMTKLGSPPGDAELIEPLQTQLKVIDPLLDNHRVHIPVWAIAATRID